MYGSIIPINNDNAKASDEADVHGKKARSPAEGCYTKRQPKAVAGQRCSKDLVGTMKGSRRCSSSFQLTIA